jgi:hypothetical protein
MAELIGLINDMSTFVKLAWVGVLAWGAVQFVWYQRARVVPGEIESSPEASSGSWLAGRQFASVTRPPEDEPIEVPRARSASANEPGGVRDFALDTPETS